MRIWFLIFVIVYVLGCQSPRKLTRTQRQCVDSLERMAKTDWRYSTEKGWYEIGDSLEAALYGRRFYHCIRGVDTARIIQIFGREGISITTKDIQGGWKDSSKAVLEYPTSVRLNDLAKQGKGGMETTLYVYFDHEGKVRWMIYYETFVVPSH